MKKLLLVLLAVLFFCAGAFLNVPASSASADEDAQEETEVAEDGDVYDVEMDEEDESGDLDAGYDYSSEDEADEEDEEDEE